MAKIKYNDVPFVPGSDCSHYEECREDAYQQGRLDALEELLNNVSESIIWDILAEIMKRNICASDGADKVIDYLQKVAEELKGGLNERTKIML